MSKGLRDLSDFFRIGSEQKEDIAFPSGLPGLDAAMGCPQGIPGRAIVEIIASEKRGKTTLSYLWVANAQRNGIKDIEVPIKGKTKIINAVWVDFERSYDPKYAASLGVDTDKLLILEASYAEDNFNAVEHLLTAGIQMVVIDSVPMAMPKSEEDKEVTENEKMAAIAGLMTRVCKRLILLADTANALIILVNQWRANIALMSRSDKKPYGARAIHYAAKVIIHLERIKNGDDQATIQAYVDKTKFGPERRTTEFELIYGHGFDVAGHIIALAADYDIVERTGAWYYYPSKNDPVYKAQGMSQARETMPIEEIKSAVIQRLTT